MSASHKYKTPIRSDDGGILHAPWDQDAFSAFEFQVTEVFCSQDVLQRLSPGTLLHHVVQMSAPSCVLFPLTLTLETSNPWSYYGTAIEYHILPGYRHIGGQWLLARPQCPIESKLLEPAQLIAGGIEVSAGEEKRRE